jgi:hypothetical protein
MANKTGRNQHSAAQWGGSTTVSQVREYLDANLTVALNDFLFAAGSLNVPAMRSAAKRLRQIVTRLEAYQRTVERKVRGKGGN